MKIKIDLKLITVLEAVFLMKNNYGWIDGDKKCLIIEQLH